LGESSYREGTEGHSVETESESEREEEGKREQRKCFVYITMVGFVKIRGLQTLD
jgi:hypothetical protein